MVPRWVPWSLGCGFTPILLSPSQFNWLLTKCHYYMQSRAWGNTTPDEVVAFWLKYPSGGVGSLPPGRGGNWAKASFQPKLFREFHPHLQKIIPLLSAPLPQGAVRTSFQTLRRPTLHAGWWIMPLQMSVMQAEHLSSPADAASGDKVSLR